MTTATAALKPWTELRVMRGKDGCTLQQLSKASGVAVGHLSDLENGKREPTGRVIAKIAKALNVPKSMIEKREHDMVEATHA